MKKIIFASLLLIGASAVHAATACDPTATTRSQVTGSASNFVRVSFNPVCSANSYVVYTDDATNQKLYGGAASVKGASYFGASTLGGAVARVGACTNNSCGGGGAATQAGNGMTAANAYGT